MTRVDKIDTNLILRSFDGAMEQTFETYFFMEATPLPAESNTSSAEQSIDVELVFRGPFSGHLHLSVSVETALGLVSSMPIAFEEVNDSLVSDLFAELTNTIGGRIASNLAGEDFAFDLTIPEVTIGSAKTSASKDASRLYQTDYGTITLSVSHLTEQKIPFAKGA